MNTDCTDCHRFLCLLMRCFILFEELLRARSQDSSNKIKPLFTNKADQQVCHQLSIKIFEIDFLEILSEATQR